MIRKIILLIFMMSLTIKAYSYTCLTFTTEQNAIDALAQVNINYGVELIPTCNNSLALDKQYTTSWSTIHKVHGQDKWYFTKPDVSLMIGVTDYQEEEFSIGWLAPHYLRE
ncbi:MAG: hypothetical protein ACFFG0_03425 [Candidatus Thorarchaeota archaeon]